MSISTLTTFHKRHIFTLTPLHTLGCVIHVLHDWSKVKRTGQFNLTINNLICLPGGDTFFALFTRIKCQIAQFFSISSKRVNKLCFFVGKENDARFIVSLPETNLGLKQSRSRHVGKLGANNVRLLTPLLNSTHLS